MGSFTTKQKRIIIALFIFYGIGAAFVAMDFSHKETGVLILWALLLIGYWVAVFLLNWIRKAE